MPTLVLIRHALRERHGQDDEYREKLLGLHRTGVLQAKALAEQLVKIGCIPGVYYTSCFAHARQTADLVRERLPNTAADVVELCSLTPHYQGPREWRNSERRWTGLEILKTVDKESDCIGRGMRQFDTVAMILHKPRIEQILAGLTLQDEARFRDLDYGSGVWAKGDSWDTLLQGGVTEYARLRVTLGLD